MTEQIVVGLFGALGTAEDAHNRLRTEGFPESDMALRELKATGPIPQTMAPETADFAIDPVFGITISRKDLMTIHNGETAVYVRTRSEDEAQAAIDTLRQYAPIDVKVLASFKEGALREEAQPNDRSHEKRR
jgi:hypothetical protein